MIDSHYEEVFVESRRSVVPKVLAGAAAIVITALVLIGYTALRKRHAQDTASLASSSQPASATHQPPQALVMVDDALLQGSKTTIGGSVRNTSAQKLEGLSVELELKRRGNGSLEKQLVVLNPAQLEPQQEGRYSLELKAQDYSSARLVALKSGPNLVALPFATAQGQKRLPERLESKTIIVNKPSGTKSGEFLNTPDNPVRVP